MNLISHDIYTLLLDNGFTNLVDGEFDSKQDEVTLVISNEQPASDLKDTYYQDGFQIFVRTDKRGSQRDAWESIVAVHSFLLALPETFTVNGCEYKGVEMETSIATLGRDENERFMCSCNYFTYRAPLSV